MELNFTLIDDQNEPIEVFCQIFERGASRYWRAWLYGSVSLRETLEGRAADERAIPGQVQAEILLRGIRASD
ncbi:hypothetical protein [Dyella japonica]|uniref:Uncharacterized protein n=1 Tax=Dyella japonica TaxID=231455 RepID=A0ABV2K405_9GAMM